MANHRIDESISEYTSSVLSIHDNNRRATHKSGIDPNRRSAMFGGNPGLKDSDFPV